MATDHTIEGTISQEKKKKTWENRWNIDGSSQNKKQSIEAHGILVWKGTAVYIEPGLLIG